MEYSVKVRKETAKAWTFLTPKGGTNKLRVHAMRCTLERAKEIVDNWNNPGWTAKVVEL